MRAGCLAIALFFHAAMAAAQFKWVDQDGHIGYGDKPPPGAHHVEQLDAYQPGSRPDAQASLPYELRLTLQKYPATLYTTKDCPGCVLGRQLLQRRGIPFSERTVDYADEAQELKKLGGSGKLPALQIGSRTLTGFNSGQWDDALDLAGYPGQSQLPPDWKWPAARPLVEPKPQPASPPPDATAKAPTREPAPASDAPK
jgi:glutaredoxin